MNPSALIIGETTSTLSLSPDAHALKAKAIEEAKLVTAVSSQPELVTAVECRRALHDITKGVEKTREELKAPILDAGRKLDGIAKDFSADLTKETARLDGLINAFHKRQADEAATRQREAETKAKEAETARIKAQDEADRLKAELAKSEAALEKVKDEATRATLAGQIGEMRELALEKELDAELSAPPPAPIGTCVPKIEGVSAKPVIRWQLGGNNKREWQRNFIRLLQYHPDCFTFRYDANDQPVSIHIQNKTISDKLNGALPAFDQVPDEIRNWDDVKTTIR